MGLGGVPKSWGDGVPRIGGTPQQQQQQPQEQQVEVPPEFVKGLIYLICVPNAGINVYTPPGTPMGIEPGMITVIQAFGQSKDDPEKIVEYRHLQFINPVGASMYLCKPPQWWEKVLNKETELAS
jgi:hypothetical protein